jgi:hypothetical protein
MNGHGGPCPSRGIPKSKAPQPICQVGRDSVIAVRENIGRRGLRPSRAIGKPRAPWDICQSERDCVLAMRMRRGRGTVPLPRSFPGRGRVPAVRENMGHRGLCPSHKVAWEGPSPRGQQEYRAQGTVPLPRDRQTKGILGHPLIRAVLCVWGQCPTGTEDCAPPGPLANQGRLGTSAIPSGTACLRCACGGDAGLCPSHDRYVVGAAPPQLTGISARAYCAASGDCSCGAGFSVCSPGSPCLCGPSGGRKLLAETLFEKNAGAVLTDSVELVQGGAKSQLMLNLIGSYAVGS